MARAEPRRPIIAHEINNPLEAITNLLYLLSGHLKENPEARNYIDLAESELQRISAITKQTLRWARGDDSQKPEHGSARALIEDVLRLYSGQIKNREVHVIMKSPTDIPVYGTLGQLTQVLANLIANAVQAVSVGGRIWLSYTHQGDTTKIIIRDEGHGMSDETIRNLFQPFYSTKGDLGNGLGLYISREIVERLQRHPHSRKRFRPRNRRLPSPARLSRLSRQPTPPAKPATRRIWIN